MRGQALVAVWFAAMAGVGCRESLNRADASGSAGSTGQGGGGASGGGGTSSGGADGPCSATPHSFPATPVDPDAGARSCTFTVPPPDDGQTNFIVRLDDAAASPRDTTHDNGWDYTDALLRTIQFFGAACDAITAGTVHRVCIEYQYISDRDAKRDLRPVDREQILERLARLPIATWSYKSDAQQTRHIGPMAQDFKLTFDVGSTDKAIFPLDESGVAFAAIQALDEKVRRLADENARLKKQIAELRARTKRR